jgi:hypothetical protein
MTFRLIDDVFSVDNPYFMEAISKPYESGGIYPSALSLNDTSISSEHIHFLGMSIRDVLGKLFLNVFDKRREFPFAVCRYPHKRSLIPVYIAYGVFTGLLHRYYRICTEFDDFCDNASLLAHTLIVQGWKVQQLRKIFGNFIRSRLGFRWRISIQDCCKRFAHKTTSLHVSDKTSQMEFSYLD